MAELKQISLVEAIRGGWGRSSLDRLLNAFFIVLTVLGGVLGPVLVLAPHGYQPWVVGGFVVSFLFVMLVFFAGVAIGIRREMNEDVLAERKPPPLSLAGLKHQKLLGTCSQCGAPLYFGVVDAAVVCAHCRANVLPSDELRQRMLELSQFETDLQKARDSRAHARGLAGGAFDAIVDSISWVVARMLLLTPILVAYVATLLTPDLLRAELEPLALDLVSAALFGSGILLSGLLLFLSSRVERYLVRRGARFRGFSQLVEPWGARINTQGTREAFDWLDAHWALPTPEGALITHNSDQGKSVQRWTASFSYRGAPVLAMLANAPHVQRFDVFLASHDRGRVGRLPPAVRDAILQTGMQVEAGSAGVHCWAATADPRLLSVQGFNWLLQTAAALASSRS